MNKPMITSLGQISPVILQKYEKYLPTAFDESLTLLEKVNKVILYLNQIGEATNNVVDQWNAVMEWLLENGLESEINERLNEMLLDGSFNTIINETILGSKSSLILDVNPPDNPDPSTYWLEGTPEQFQMNKFDGVTWEKLFPITLLENIKDVNGKTLAEYLSEKVGAGDLPYTTNPEKTTIRPKTSIYLGNDHNLFGEDSEGIGRNLITMQDNNIVDVGEHGHVMWLRGGGKWIGLRTPKAEIVETDAEGNVLSPASELYHVRNQGHHVILNAVGEQTLTEDMRNYPTLLTNLVSAFPLDHINGIDYTIPRTGVYGFNFVLRTTGVSNMISVVRIGFTREKDTNPVHTDAGSILLSSQYGTDFYSGTFFYHLQKGEIITPFIMPHNEALTLQAGTKLYIQYLGDRA